MEISNLLPDDDMSKIIKFVAIINKLKKEIRYSQVTNKKWDSVADHTRRVTMLCFLLARKQNDWLDVNKVVMIGLMHDLAEVMTGDIDVSLVYRWNITKEEKFAEEDNQIKILLKTLPDDLADEIYWYRKDYRFGDSDEAKFVKAVDKMEWTLHYIQEDFEWPFLPFMRQHGNKEVAASWRLNNFYEKIKVLIEKFIKKHE